MEGTTIARRATAPSLATFATCHITCYLGRRTPSEPRAGAGQISSLGTQDSPEEEFAGEDVPAVLFERGQEFQRDPGGT